MENTNITDLIFSIEINREFILLSPGLIVLAFLGGTFIYTGVLIITGRGLLTTKSDSEQEIFPGYYSWRSWTIHMIKMPVYTILLWLVFFAIIDLLDLILTSFLNWLYL